MVNKVAILAGATGVFTLAALGLISYHTEQRCHSKVGDISSSECNGTYKEMCVNADAFGVSTTITDSGMEIEMMLRCPWQKATSITGLIGLSLTQIFLGLLAAVMKGKTALKVPVVALAGVIVPLLLSTFSLMIKDLKTSFEHADDVNAGSAFRPGSYIANCILIFFGICLISGAAFLGFKSDEDGVAKNNAKAGVPAGNHHQLNQNPTPSHNDVERHI